MPIRRERAEQAIDALAGQLGLSATATALGIVQVASATIVKAIRTISVERGHDPGEFTLFPFGGAGPLHATEVARELGVRRLVVPPSPGILCAEGLLISDMTADFVHARLLPLDGSATDAVNEGLASLRAQAEAWFVREGVATERRRQAWQADMRYVGQNFELSVPISGTPYDKGAISELAVAFQAAHELAYGFAQSDEPMQLVSLRLKVTGALDKPKLPEWPEGAETQPRSRRRVLFDAGAWHDAQIYRRSDLVRWRHRETPWH